MRGRRDLIRSKKITMEDAMEARKLVDFPGGLELHIGVSERLSSARCGMHACMPCMRMPCMLATCSLPEFLCCCVPERLCGAR
jgi:hypothetical protein